jgi:site-specific recombinase XerD
MTSLFSQVNVEEIAGRYPAGALTLDQSVGLFETIYMPSRNFTQLTRVAYKIDVTQLIEYLRSGGVLKPQEVSLTALQSFLAHLDGRGLSGATRRRKTASIKAFFGFLTTAGVITADPAKQLVPPEREYKEPRFLTTQEYQGLLRACAHESRDTAIIEMLLQTGIRLSEAVKLTVYDIDLPKHIRADGERMGIIAVKGKGRKNRTLPLNYKACKALNAWLNIRPNISDPALFVSKFGEPMGERAIQRMVAKYCQIARIRHASVHSLRHSFATHHVAKGTDLKAVQEALGHESLETTSIYLSTAKSALKRYLRDNAL